MRNEGNKYSDKYSNCVGENLPTKLQQVHQHMQLAAAAAEKEEEEGEGEGERDLVGMRNPAAVG